MKILIIEDETIIARRISRMTINHFQETNVKLHHCDDLSDGIRYLNDNKIDLLLLDLNLNGEDGFEVLKQVSAQTFHTIIISAYVEKAITAFEYGVLDFVSKPFNEARLSSALSRYGEIGAKGETTAKYLIVQNQGSFHQVDVQSILFIKGARIYTELFLVSGKREIHNKSLDALTQILPNHFVRVHRSYIVNMKEVTTIDAKSGGNYSLWIKGETNIPVSRSRYKKLKEQWFNE